MRSIVFCTTLTEKGLEIIPDCLESLGLIQRTYDGSLDIRISMSFARLALNWVAAWRGRHRNMMNERWLAGDREMKARGRWVANGAKT